MNREQLKALVLALREFPESDRRDAVERAMLIVTGVATFDDIDAYSFDWTAKLGGPDHKLGDGRRLGER
jgi:hypothetical protein